MFCFHVLYGGIIQGAEPPDSDDEILSARWRSGRYSSWNIAKYSAIKLPHIARYADP